MRGSPDSPAPLYRRDAPQYSLGTIIEHKFSYSQGENVAGRRSAVNFEGRLIPLAPFRKGGMKFVRVRFTAEGAEFAEKDGTENCRMKSKECKMKTRG